MRSKTIGAILMILGTSIGAGMIALPVAAAQENYLMSLILLVVSWLIMTFGAFALLEVTLWFGKNKNILSMAKATLGLPGQILTWIIYLFLLYSLLCAYLSGISDVIHKLLQMIHFTIPHWLESVLGVVLLGMVIYRGIRWVDFLNRGLMSLKGIIYILIAILLVSKVSPTYLMVSHGGANLSTLMVMITSFGYAIIIPSLVDYLERDSRAIHCAVLIGSLIPLVIYAIWIAVIQGVIPRATLLHIATEGRTVFELLNAMQQYAGTAWIAILANVFMSICAFTSFLGVSLCLVDFLADGTNINKRSHKGIIVYLLTFLPPLLIVIIDPNIFVKALSYAGIFCVVLLVVLPLSMVLCGRYWKKYQHDFRVPGRWVSVVLGLLLSIGLTIILIVQGT